MKLFCILHSLAIVLRFPGVLLIFLVVGHLGVSFYFIVSGTVTVQREEKDDRTSEKHVQVRIINDELMKISKNYISGNFAVMNLPCLSFVMKVRLTIS